MFKNPVTRFLPSAKNMVTGVILPNFNWDLPEGSPEWKKSYIPYRSQTDRDEQGHLQVQAACAFVMVHSRVGPREDDLVSPLSRQHLWRPENDFGGMDDPLVDMNAVAKAETSPFNKLTKDGSGKNGYAALSYPSTKCVYNFLGVNAKDLGSPMKQGVLLMPKAAHVEYMRLMNIPRMAGQVPTPRDPEWPDYLYGDVTNPNRPLVVRTMQRVNPTNESNRFTGWAFSANEVSLMGADTGAVIPEAILTNRINIFDPRVYNLLVYQQLVDQMLEENWFPRELIIQACSGKANIGGVQHTGMPEMQYQQSAQPPQSAYQTSPYQNTPQASSGEDDLPLGDLYWVSGPDGVKEVSTDFLNKMVRAAGSASIPVMAHNQVGGWKTAADFGFSYTPPVPPSGPPAPPAGPPAGPPAPPAGPPAPPTAGPPAQASGPTDVTQLPHYAEFAGKSAEELTAFVNSCTAQLVTGTLDSEGVSKMQTAHALSRHLSGA